MKILYSQHAHKRLRARGISPADVKKVIRQPDRFNPSPERNRHIVSKTQNGKILEVIYTIEQSDIIVITAYYI